MIRFLQIFTLFKLLSPAERAENRRKKIELWIPSLRLRKFLDESLLTSLLFKTLKRRTQFSLG
jgi:hypothetical protein